MSTLYIRLPSKAVADSAPNWLDLACPFALTTHADAIEREGIRSLQNLSATIAGVQRVVLLLSGTDVTLLRMQVPPLSEAKLKAALPNLVEDRLLCDPSGCLIVAGKPSDGMRSIAVIQRAWIELLAKTFLGYGAHRIAAFPAQACLLPSSSTPLTAAIHGYGTDVDLAVRLPEQEGIGLTIPITDTANDAATDKIAAPHVIEALCALKPTAPITVYVPQLSVHMYQDALADMPVAQGRIRIQPDLWTRWIDGARDVQLDLMAELGTNRASVLAWQAWRWPLALAATVLLVNVGALNLEWWRMHKEADSLRSAMFRIYKSAYPNETVIIDPVAQMQQKVTAARRDSGLAAPDDFTTATAAFGEAWRSVTATLATPPSIAALEYRDRNLFIRLKGPDAPTQQMRDALSKNGLALDLEPASAGMPVWKIRSLK